MNGPGHDIFVKTVGAYLKVWLQSPTFILNSKYPTGEKPGIFCGDAKAIFLEAMTVNTEYVDRRFTHQLWKSSPFFKYVLKQYQANSDMIKTAVAQVEGLSPKDQARQSIFCQIIDDGSH